MAILLCTDDKFVAIPESLLEKEVAIEKCFECCERVFFPSDFKRVDIQHDDYDIILSQKAYLNTKGKDTAIIKRSTKTDLHLELTDDEKSQHRTAAGRLPWISTGTFPTSANLASMALEGKTNKFAVVNICREAYEKIPNEEHASLRYIPFDFDTIHIRVFADG